MRVGGKWMVKSLSQVELNTVCVEMIWFESSKHRALVSECNEVYMSWDSTHHVSTCRETACRILCVH
jgi:hypothetical protein